MDISDAGFAAGAFALAMAVVEVAKQAIKALTATLSKRKDAPSAKSCPDHTAILGKIADQQARTAEVLERMFEIQITMGAKVDVALRDIAVIREHRESA